jgi:hypothetical protein
MLKELRAQHDRVQTFLYVLMRDRLHTGAVEDLMDHVRQLKGREPKFTSQHLAEYADCLAEELLLDVAGGCCDEARMGDGTPARLAPKPQLLVGEFAEIRFHSLGTRIP